MSNSLMILGDFNNTLSEIDRCGKTVHTYDKGNNALFEFMNKHSVDDLWRNRNKKEKVFSRKMVIENRLVQSRIDYILTSKDLNKYV